MQASAILLVDLQTKLTKAFTTMLQKQGFEVLVSNDLESIDQDFREHVISTAIVSMDASGLDGLGIIQHISREHPAVVILAITENPTAHQVSQALELGAKDYFVRPIQDWNRFYFQLRQAQQLWSEQLELLRFRKIQSELQYFRTRSSLDGIKGRSEGIRNVLSQIRKIAQLDVATLIIGESGVGKERVAKALHTESGRTGSFVAVNCASIAPELFEAELFGHRKGSFTGASQTRAGLCRTSANGTLFLDEVGELPMALQAKLLRLLEQREFRPVGADAPEPFTGRIITATNVDLEEAVQKGLFREDLYFRLSVQELFVPPLRDRPEDIQLLAYHFIEEFNSPCNRNVASISPEALRILEKYDWHRNNVRELQREIQRALVRADENEKELLPAHLFWHRGKQSLPVSIDSIHGTMSESPEWYELDYASAKKIAHRLFLSTYLPYHIDKHDGNKSQAAMSVGLQPPNFSRLWKEMLENHPDKEAF